MSKKDQEEKENKKFEYPKEGVNRLYDSLFKMQGFEQVIESIPDEKTKREILNFAAGLSAQFSTEIEGLEKNLTAQDARKIYEGVAQNLGKSQAEVMNTVKILEEQEKINKLRAEKAAARQKDKKDQD